MTSEQTKRPRIYFSDIQRKWSILQVGAAREMIDGLSRHGDEADPLGELKHVPNQAA
ncbi:hypothetical protein [Nisaea sp.]|uniref:hypothetical protein n=1 Tax=Nisaea sp. TaxID=2024842 RepID=UPI003B529E16